MSMVFGVQCPQQRSTRCLGVPGGTLQGDCCCLVLPGMTTGQVICWHGQAQRGQEQGDRGRKLEVAGDGAAGLWHHSVLAGAKLESGHREHQRLILRDLLWSVSGAGSHTVVVFCQSFLQCRITTSVPGH